MNILWERYVRFHRNQKKNVFILHIYKLDYKLNKLKYIYKLED